MASGFHFVMVLCLTSGLAVGRRDCKVTLAEQDMPCCPSGWTLHGSRCFIFHHSAKAWLDAERVCISLGGNLASIHSLDEHNFLRGLINRVTGSYTQAWIGGFDAIKEGVWMWTDGSKVDYTNWHTGEPNNLNAEHCLEMNFGGNRWNDQGCDSKRSFVCSQGM
ncbi:galactose-specific lectin nattectin-like isoform X2 [Centroberyx gerrardi]